MTAHRKLSLSLKNSPTAELMKTISQRLKKGESAISGKSMAKLTPPQREVQQAVERQMGTTFKHYSSFDRAANQVLGGLLLGVMTPFAFAESFSLGNEKK